MNLSKIKNYLKPILILVLSYCSVLNAQIQVDYDSNTTTDNQHLTLTETGDADDWTRIFLRNDSDATNYWSMVAKPQTGEQDPDGILDSPFAFAYSGTQVFGVSKDGFVRINKQFILPNMDGTDGQVFMTDGSGVVDFEWLNYTQRQSTLSNPALRIHNPIDASAHLTFSNGGFADNRFAIVADPSGSNAEMKFLWGNITNPAGATNYLEFGFDSAVDSDPYVTTNERVGIGTIPYNTATSGFKFHVVSADEPAAHFGEQSASNPANGYVTVNRPTGLSGDIILKLRADGSTKVDFHEDEAEFFVPALFREDVSLVTADLDVGGDVVIGDLLVIEPRALQPACAAGGADNGTVIFYQAGGTKKLQVCVDGSWENLN